MRVGIISDTHDNLLNLKKIVDIFREKGIDTVLHGGDFVSPFVLRAMEGLFANLTGVFGNNDGDKLMLRSIAEKAEWDIQKPPYAFDIGRKKALLLHEPDILETAIKSGLYDLVIYGHTHKSDIRKEGKTLIINPGEAGGWTSGKGSAVILDTDTMQEEFFTF